MDPDYQDESTFAETTVVVKTLRFNRKDSWDDWRMTVANMADAGERMEQSQRNMKVDIERCLRKSKFEEYVDEMRPLKIEYDSRQTRWRRYLDAGVQIFATVAGSLILLLIGHWLHIIN